MLIMIGYCSSADRVWSCGSKLLVTVNIVNLRRCKQHAGVHAGGCD